MKRLIPAAALTMMCAAASASPAVNNSSAMNPESLVLLVGSYAPADSAGIALYSFNQSTGQAQKLAGLAGVSNPSYLTVSAEKGLIYSVGEGGGTNSTVNTIAYTLQPPTLSLTGSVPTGGSSPCHVNVSPDGSQLFTANYGGGSATCCLLDSQGATVGDASVIDFNTPRRAAHAHFATFTPDGRWLWVTDLGRDLLHRFPVTDGRVDWRASAMRDFALPEGSGPRHVDFIPQLQRAYIIDELDGMINVLDYSAEPPVLLQRILADLEGGHGSGDIHASPDGRFVYASNRLKGDGIAVFSVDPHTGLLTFAGYQPTGPHPRNFIITPNGKFMLVACRDNNAIELYAINPTTGLLSPTGQSIGFSKPVCLRWVY